MFIVVESGSTKADWMVIREKNETAYSTKGFNPYFHSKEDILIELSDHLELGLIKDDVTEIYFYGAGCSSPELNKIIERGLKAFFVNAEVSVGHDLEACAFSCYSGRNLISCIIGTGSNSCFYDGNEVSEAVPALGHILGDEASGSYFGKKLLADYLYKRLPSKIHEELKSKGLTKDVIVDNVYRKPDANVYIASFMPVLIRNKDLEYSQKIIREGFQVFLDTHVKCYSNYTDCEVSFVGSVADLLQDELRAVCAENGIIVGKIIRRPLVNLVAYHKNVRGDVQNSLAKENTSNFS